MSAFLQDLFYAVCLFGAMLASLEVGFRAGRRAVQEGDTKGGGQVSAIQGAMLGLLGLLLGFSFAAAGARFLERQDLIVNEANAIGTAYLRADLLESPYREQLRGELAAYTRERIAIASSLRDGISQADNAPFEAYHARMWEAAKAGVRSQPALTLAVLDPINLVFDLHSTRRAAGRKHLPRLVMGLLIASSMLSIGVIGFGCGAGGRRRASMTISLSLLVSSALWITIDLDRPRAGLLQLSDEPLAALQFEEASKPPPPQPGDR